jgi:4-hydroxybenzoate polyprenyltransferase
VVDVDGTLLCTDLLWEGIVHLAMRRPVRLLGLVRALFAGKAALKHYVARESDLRIADLPMRAAVVDLIARARAEGRPVVLASGAHESQVAALARRVEADVALGSTEQTNLTGRAKLQLLQDRFVTFDYIGNAGVDLPLWEACRTPMAAGASSLVRRRGRHRRADLVVLPAEERRRGRRAWLRALRPHQGAKNLLLLLPALAAHMAWTPALLLRLVAGIVAFSALASAVYLMNDIADLSHDRAHPTKRNRPIAAGHLSIRSAVTAAIALLAVSATLAWYLPSAFALVLAAYLVITTAYSLTLKRRAMVDVITLATLYSTRILAGAVLAGVVLSRWFLAFSVFLFFSLSLVKRVTELLKTSTGEDYLNGRGYAAADLPVLIALGGSATAATSLVYCLYITGDDVTQLYSRPDILWFGLPLLLYWQARIWLLTVRKRVDEDPVVFALRDRTSYLTFIAFLLVVFVAA